MCVCGRAGGTVHWNGPWSATGCTGTAIAAGAPAPPAPSRQDAAGGGGRAGGAPGRTGDKESPSRGLPRGERPRPAGLPKAWRAGAAGRAASVLRGAAAAAAEDRPWAGRTQGSALGAGLPPPLQGDEVRRPRGT